MSAENTQSASDRNVNLQRWLIALSVILPTFIEVVDTTVVNVSLDHIRGSLSAGMDEVTWTLTSYLVSNAIIIPLTGWFCKLFGRKRYLIFSVALFTFSSFMCGVAWNLESLIFFRVMQGIGGGALQPLSHAILFETFPPRLHGLAMSVFGLGVVFAPIIGPLIGGWVSDNWSWRWIFYINVPIGILSIILNSVFIKDPPYMKKVKMRIDYAGLALLIVGLGCLQIVLDKGQQEDWFASNFITILSFISVFSLAVFVVVENFIKQPVVDFSVFRDITFSTGCTVMFAMYFSFLATTVLLPLYLQTLMGYNSTLAGEVIGLGGLPMLITMPIVGVLVQKINPKYVLAVGVCLTSTAAFLFSELNLSADFMAVLIPRAILGIGAGCFFIPLMTLTMSHIERERMSNASGMFNLIRNTGGSIGISLAMTILARSTQTTQFDLIGRLNPFNLNYQNAVNSIVAFFGTRGITGAAAKHAADASIYMELQRQASMISFNKVSMITFFALILNLPLILIMRHRKGGEHTESVH
ncbi:MAG: DHA2 family efflux MFS transporter permease subunit [Nitrospirae bacterium]|nr:DHA2 family efflux MFS transporter permease subunit [Nitrospirota bacterium]MBF0618096.1 DHA2 family efflux MFS transporter permease subunit [Nitrospirota bacterium]